jgi:hypothetical protein
MLSKPRKNKGKYPTAHAQNNGNLSAASMVEPTVMYAKQIVQKLKSHMKGLVPEKAEH